MNSGDYWPSWLQRLTQMLAVFRNRLITASVCRAFQRAIVQNHELTRPQSETLVLFLMDNCTELFKTPTSLIEAVRRTLRTMQQGIDPDSITTFTFCQQVAPQDYEDQREATTLESLKFIFSFLTVQFNSITGLAFFVFFTDASCY
ncbi:DEP domain-containing protein 7-like [Cebidichthys violaceus]|uniref:DEP domain-containing protein 7-like n=1 Tax=Cebidichthys violaceus TaxID=271503 RepID=UPI0035CC249B